MIGTIIAAGLGLAGAAIGSSAAGNAAQVQAGAANQSAQLQANASAAALAEQQRQFNITQANIAPWLQTGTSSLANLAYLMGLPTGTNTGTQNAALGPQAGNPNFTGGGLTGRNPNAPMLGGGRPTGAGWEGNMLSLADAPPSIGDDSGIDTGRPQPGATTSTQPGVNPLVNPELGGFGSLMQNWETPFEPPTAENIQEDPGYQFRLREGMRALENSAAARGGLLTGATAQAMGQYSQDMASTEYGNAYQRALQQYQQQYNIFRQNQATQFNQLAALSGAGQTAAGQLSNAGQNSAANISNILLTGAQNQGNALMNAGAATASGYVGSANAWNNYLSNLSNLTGRL